MKPSEIHRAWAPADGGWTPWVKPVLFAALHHHPVEPEPRVVLPEPPEWLSPEHRGPYREARSRDTAVVIDRPSDAGVELGIALTQHGFRPIPLYNALPSPVAIVDVSAIMSALVRDAELVAKVPPSAPPAFLLDARRMGRGSSVHAGLFDNRSMCRPSDFPSATHLRQAGIARIVLVCDEIQDDLEAIALEWQTAGLELWLNDAPITLRRPWLGRRLWKQLFGFALQPGANGAYGVMIEQPTVS